MPLRTLAILVIRPTLQGDGESVYMGKVSIGNAPMSDNLSTSSAPTNVTGIAFNNGTLIAPTDKLQRDWT
jgi:hypothetical protein